MNNSRVIDGFLRVCGIIVLIVGVVVTLFPMLWSVLLSFKTNEEILRIPPTFLPDKATLEGYRLVLTKTPIARWFANSVLVSAAVVCSVGLTSAIAGYVFAKFDFKCKGPLFLLVLSTMMVPFQVTMIPLYLICTSLGMLGRLSALIVPSLVSAFGIFLCRQYIEEVPNETIESGRLEGAGEFLIFFRLILPTITPAIAALSIFTFIGKWNDYMWPLIVINSEKRMTMPLALSFFNSARVQNLNAMMSANVVVIVPIIIVFLIFQKSFIEGLTIQGLK